MPEYSGVAPSPPRPSKRSRHFQEERAPVVPPPPPPPFLPNDLILEQILPRVPAAAIVRFRAVCREWRAALTSDHFVRAHRAAAAAQAPPEIVFFAPAAGDPAATSFYSSALTTTSSSSTAQRNGSAAAARELVTMTGAMRAGDLVLASTKPCRGLTLLAHPSVSEHHVCNLSTGEHVSLPRCRWARRVTSQGPYVLSGAGLGFDEAANEHKVVRLFEDWNQQQRCEVYGLRSGGGWRPCAGEAPPHAAKGLCGRPPVFVDGCFYWHVDATVNFDGWQAGFFSTPEPILSLAVDTERFRWVHPPEERARWVFNLTDLDGALCAVVDDRIGAGQYELWTLTAPAAWSLRCRIGLASLPRPMSDALRAGCRMLPLGTTSPAAAPGGEGEILLATSRHEVYAYDPESNRARRAFSATDIIDTLTHESSELALNIAIHEEWVTPVWRCPDEVVGKLKMKPGNNRTVVARQGGQGRPTTDRLRDDVTVMVMWMFGLGRDN